ncbi:MAG: 2-phospho-L-lactate transferase [Thaumarchaeota archaeon]|nr:2-phospho-L-lactate transferase [Nitrososphaerota archaeon]
MRVTVLAGGTGSIKLIRGLDKCPDLDISVISNVGDNIWIHGLYVCPDIDIVMYGLAGILNQKQGWGIQGDTFNFMAQAEAYRRDTWFKLGDMDLATHIVRTELLEEGLNLTEITRQLSKTLGIRHKIVPATNNSLQTFVRNAKEEVHLQEFWVKGKGRGVVKDVVYRGARTAKITPEVDQAIESADLILILPANPITSIGPILSIPRIRKKIRASRAKCVGISPIIGNKPISGPTNKLLAALGIEVSVLGIAKLYSDVISKIFISKEDGRLNDKIRDHDVEPYTSQILMNDELQEKELAKEILKRALE